MVRNARSKFTRTKKNYGIDLESEINIPSLNEFRTRKEFNEWKREMEWFTNRSNLKYQYRKNEHGLVANKQELREINKRNEVIIKNAKKELKELGKKPYFVSGKESGKLAERFSQFEKNPLGIVVPKPFDFHSVRNRTELNRWKEKTKKKSDPEYYNKRNSQMQQNFIETIEFSFNSDGERLVDMLRQLPPDDFFEIYTMFDAFDFNLYASKNTGGLPTNSNLKRMESYLEQYFEGKLDMDFKGF